VKREAFNHKSVFVILEDVVLGVCDKRGNRNASAGILKQIQAIATGKIPPERTERLPVVPIRQDGAHFPDTQAETRFAPYREKGS